MHDDPFARAVERAQAHEQHEAALKRERWERRVSSGARTGFRTHASVFVAVNVLLIVIWATTGGPGTYPWFLYPLLGWLIGLVAHYAAAANHLGRRGRDRHPPAPYPAAHAAPVQVAPAPLAVTPVAPAPVPPAPARAAAPSSTIEDLTRLAELHRAGALTDEEFASAKARLLA